MNEQIRAQLLGGTLANHKTHLAGFFRGYYMTFHEVEGGYRLTVNASSPNDSANVALDGYLKNCCKQEKKLRSVETLPHRFTLIFAACSKKKLPAMVNGIVEPILSHLALHAYTSGCGHCGSNAASLGCWSVNGAIYQMCDACAAEVEASLDTSKQEIKKKKSSLLSGLVGAFLGALIGIAAWLLIYRLGYIAGLAGLVMAVCALKGYELLGKHLDIKGVIGTIVILIAGVYLANKLAWAWEAYDALHAAFDLTFSDCFRSLEPILAESEVLAAYYGELAIGYLLTAVASFTTIFRAVRASRGSYTFKKLS